MSGKTELLTAEQVRELIAPHLHARPTFDFGRHGAVWRADFQAIADELNARAERTCSITEYGESDNPGAIVKPCKFSCGHWGSTFDRFCRHCGAKVRSE